MTVSKAGAHLKAARRELADAIDALPKSFLAMRSRSKRSKIRCAISAVDKAIAELRGL